MNKVILVFAALCVISANCLDRRLQNANLDFLNFEANLAKSTPKPGSTVAANQGKPVIHPDLIAGTATSTVKPNAGNVPPKSTPIAGGPKPTQTTSNINSPTSTTGAFPGLPFNKNAQPSRPGSGPALQTSSNLGLPTTPTNKPAAAPAFSWANVVSGNKNQPAAASGVPTTAPKIGTTGQASTINADAPTTGPKTGTTGPSYAGAAGGPTTGAKIGTTGPSYAGAAGGPTTGPKTGTTGPSYAGAAGGSTAGPKNGQTPYAGLPPIKSASSLQPIPFNPTPRPSGPTTEAGPEIASDKELKDVSEALLKKETSNLAKHITLNYQGKTSSFSKTDLAPLPLIELKPEIWNEPTIAAMKALLDNYEQDTTVNEYVTPQEKNEENAFLDAVMATPVMRHLMLFLKEKGVVSQDPKVQRDVIKQIWFNMYSRGQGKIGSSGFEHIFLSEIKNNEISGLHNWLYFSTQEALNQANYLGYLKKLELNDKKSIVKLHFSLKGIDKPVNSMFVGTSPELELALYSLCFMTRADKPCPLSLSGQEFSLRTHTFRYRSKNMIGSAFPEL